MATSPAALKTAEDESDALLEDIANITIEAERLGGEIHQLLEVRLEGVSCAVTEAFLVPDDCITSRPFAHAHHHCLTSCPFCLPFVVSSGISLYHATLAVGSSAFSLMAALHALHPLSLLSPSAHGSLVHRMWS